MAKNTNTDSQRAGGLRGKVRPVVAVLATKTASLVALLLVYYVVVFFLAIRVVPLVFGFVKSGSGVTMDMPFETILSVWIAPSVFLLATLFAVMLIACRALWRARRRLVESVSAWAFGREEGVAHAVAPANLSTARARRTRKSA
jgi:hypothetical protein